MGNSFTFANETFFFGWSIGMYNGPISFTNETSKEMGNKNNITENGNQNISLCAHSFCNTFSNRFRDCIKMENHRFFFTLARIFGIGFWRPQKVK